MEHMTDEFIATQDPDTGEVQLWVDWIPAVDEDPCALRTGQLTHGVLEIFSQGNTRNFTTLAEPVRAAIEQLHGVVVVLCGPSGVLAQHRIKLTRPAI